MVNEDDIDNIISYRIKGYSYRDIKKKIGFSVGTIMKICKEWEEKKKNEPEKQKREKQKTEKVIQIDPLSNMSALEFIRKTVNNMDTIIRVGKLKAEEKRLLIKRRDELNEMLIKEVDEKIPIEIDKAIKNSDQDWNILIEKNYVKKEEVLNLKKRIQEIEKNTADLEDKIKEKDDLIRKYNNELSRIIYNKDKEKKDFNIDINNLQGANDSLWKENMDLRSYINNRLNNEIIERQKDLNDKRNAFNFEKINFKIQEKSKRLEIKKTESSLDIKQKYIETREKDIAKEKDHIIKLKSYLNEQKNKFQDDIKKINAEIKNQTEEIIDKKVEIEKISERQKNQAERLQKWQTNLEKTNGINKLTSQCIICHKTGLIDANDKEYKQKIKPIFKNYMHPECKKRFEQQKPIILYPPASISSEPIIQSGSIPVIQSGIPINTIATSGIPVVQTGSKPVQYNKNTKTIENMDTAFIQSGLSS